MSVVNVSYGKFSVCCMLQYLKIDLSWKLVVVYGSPYDDGRLNLLMSFI
jgi:hypothetical protein